MMKINRIPTFGYVLLFIAVLSSAFYVVARQNESILFLDDLSAGHEQSRLKSQTADPTQIPLDYESEGH